jgi:hypothetical protein
LSDILVFDRILRKCPAFIPVFCILVTKIKEFHANEKGIGITDSTVCICTKIAGCAAAESGKYCC